MFEMHWSWAEYEAAPADLVTFLVEQLDQRDENARLDAMKAKRHK